ncbi:hypothetical protein JST97_37030 [bacterium]|nr:hypothetical protein [bacterium]
MSFPIGPNRSQFTGTFAPQRSQNNFQQAVQRLGHSQPGQSPNQMQNTAGDASLSFSPEALEAMSQNQVAQGTQSGSAPSPEQLESQIQSGDLQGALNTISQLDASHPTRANDPNQSLKSQLKSQLQQGDQQGAEATLEQLKANRPTRPPAH